MLYIINGRYPYNTAARSGLTEKAVVFGTCPSSAGVHVHPVGRCIQEAVHSLRVSTSLGCFRLSRLASRDVSTLLDLEGMCSCSGMLTKAVLYIKNSKLVTTHRLHSLFRAWEFVAHSLTFQRRHWHFYTQSAVISRLFIRILMSRIYEETSHALQKQW